MAERLTADDFGDRLRDAEQVVDNIAYALCAFWTQERFVAHETQLYLVPANVPDRAAVLIEPFGRAGYFLTACVGLTFGLIGFLIAAAGVWFGERSGGKV